MRHIVIMCLLAFVSLVTSNVRADVLRQESFEGCTDTGYSLLSGSFVGTVDDGVMCGHDDGGAGAFPFSFNANVSGQHGTHFIGLEDIAGAGLTDPNAVVLSSVNIAGATQLGISFLFAVPHPGGSRYEVEDYLQLQYSVDGGAFVTVGSFRGTGAGLSGMLEDDNLDGSFTVAVSSPVMQRFSYTLDNRAGQGTVSGSSLVVRVMFSSGVQEEMAFDDIIITGTASTPTIDLSTTSYQVNEDGTPVGDQITLLRSGLTSGTATIDLTVTAGSAMGGGVDFTSTTISVPFGAGVTETTVDIPIVDDFIDEDDETFTIALSPDGSGAVAGTTTGATVTIVDDDTADVTLSASAVSIGESGTTDTYSIVLESEPIADVEIDLGTSAGEVLLSSDGSQPATMLTVTFTAGNWSTPQTIEVSAVDDTDVEADPHSDTITHVVSSLDLNYDGFAVSDIPASVADDDVCGDGLCNPTESTVTCHADCGSHCGDSACNGSETTANCSEDCGSHCGDGAVNGTEVCDGSELVGQTCGSQNFDFGTLACANDCSSFDTTGCANNTCGDGVLFGGEACDDGPNNSNVSPDACRTNCTLAGCGDDVIDTGEMCDGVDLGGETCVSLQFSSGTLFCAVNCSTYDVIGCEMDTPLDGGTDGGAANDAGADDSTDPDTATSDTATSDTASTTSDDPSGDDTTESVDSSEVPSTTSDEPTWADTTDDVDSTTAGTSEEVDTTVASSTTDVSTAETETFVVTSDIGTSDVTVTSDVDTTTDLPTSDEPDTTYVMVTSGVDTEESTSSSGNTTTHGGPVIIPGKQLDAGFDAGLDGGIVDGGVRDDGCDCRVGARRHPSGGSFLAVALVGLALSRFRRRRATANRVHQSN